MTTQEIKALREKRGMTQEAFAHFVGVTLRTVAGWESGRSQPRGLSLRRLLEIQKASGNPGEKS